MVAAGLVTRERGDVLISRRTSAQPLPGKWEFPGGKIEPGESPERALVRELHEELGARAEVGRIWDVLHHGDSSGDVIVLVYSCRLAPNEVPRPEAVADIAWVTPRELAGYDILEANAPLVDRLRREGPPDPPRRRMD